jgi:hypothetical protein
MGYVDHLPAARLHPEEPRSGVSKDEWHRWGLMVRDGAKAPPHHEDLTPAALLTERTSMNENRYYGVRVEGAKYGVGFGSALAIAISYTDNHSILWAIIHGIFGWLYVIYVALFK